MESSLLFFLIGLAVFGVDRLTKKERTTIRMLAFVIAGMLVGGILSSFIKFPILLTVRAPWFAMGIIGAIAGLIIYIADKGNWMSRPGIQYVTTILLGLGLAVLSYGFMKFYVIYSRSETPATVDNSILFIAHLFMGFLIIFGYTFPMRWFRLKKAREKEED